jgi:hypothetical protein
MSKKVAKVVVDDLSPREQAAHLKRANAMLKRTLERTLREGVAAELAKMLRDGKGYWKHPAVASLVVEGLLSRPKAFPQKRGSSLQFYGRAFSFLSAPPSCILEIGVKGGASLELWQAAFPEAQVVGADINPPGTVLSERIKVIQADQAKPETIAEIGEHFGPFNLVIDDGSHVGKHIVNSLVAISPLARCTSSRTFCPMQRTSTVVAMTAKSANSSRLA